jgi:O-succinylbenzoic acid--CoA ligase
MDHFMTSSFKFPHITINHITYPGDEVLELSEQLIGADLKRFLADWYSDQSYIWVQTSGSTGTPKKMKVSKHAMMASARRTLKFFGLRAGMSALLCLPVSYIAGKMMVVRALVGELDLVSIEPSGHPLSSVSEAIDFAAFTSMQMINEIQSAGSHLSYLKKVIIGGGKVSEELDRQLQGQLFEAYETYGMTESLSHIALRCINGVNRQTAFEPLDGVKIQADDRGCLVATVDGITDEPIVTNDLLELRHDGSFIILGREDNVINSGGIKILPERVEMKIQHLFSQSILIASLPHEKLGQQIILVVEGEIADSEGLYEAIMNNVGKYERPAHIYTVPVFPRTTSGKIIRREVIQTLRDERKVF